MQSLEAQVKAVQQKAARNARFGVALGLTRTARDAAAKVTEDLPAIFDRPTAFTKNAVTIRAANKSTLTAAVFVRPIQAQYLMMQEIGGNRLPQPGSPINIPVGQRVNQFGNIPRGAIGRVRQQPNVFVSNGQGRTAHLPPGIYQRMSVRKKKGAGSRRGRKRTTGRGAQKSRIKLLVAFEKGAIYQPRFRFQERARQAAMATLKRNIEAGIAEANRTAVEFGAITP